jgi:hyperosmotically inducible periplasmic protein
MSGMERMRYLVAAGLVIGAGAPALAQSPPPPAVVAVAAVAAAEAQPVITDAMIEAEITARLNNDVLLMHAPVKVHSKYGVVTLAGTVPTDFARRQALELARTTPGVRLLDNQLQLDISSPQAPTKY